MTNPKVWASFVLIVYVLFIIFQISNEFNIAFFLDSILVPIITMAYIILAKRKNIYFLLFLICYSVSDILGVTMHYILFYNVPFEESLIYYEYDYYIGSFLYILGYTFLLVKISKTINLKHVLKNFKIHLIVLTFLNIYLIYVLQFFVKSELEFDYEYFTEFVYNVIIFVLLSAALLAYFYRDSKKSLFIFLGALLIVFSEVMDIAYNYIDQRVLINVLASTFCLLAFYFFYKQSSLRDNGEVNKSNLYAFSDEK